MAVGFVAHDAVNFGRDDHCLATCVCLEKPSEHFLAGAARVDIGRIEKIDPEIKCRTQQGLALVFVKGPRVPAPFDLPRGGRAVGHAAKTDAGNLEAGLAEIDVVHDSFRSGTIYRDPQQPAS